MTVPISVVIPVGPLPHHREHLDDCLVSVQTQTQTPTETIIVYGNRAMFQPEGRVLPLTDRDNSIAGGFNKGVELAQNELVFLLGSDDWLKPRCLELCYAAWLRFQSPLGWYSVGVEYSNGFTQNTPCLAAMVTRALWHKAGGLRRDCAPYPSCEIDFISRMIIANGELGATYRVSDEVLYWHRIHSPGSVGIG